MHPVHLMYNYFISLKYSCHLLWIFLCSHENRKNTIWGNVLEQAVHIEQTAQFSFQSRDSKQKTKQMVTSVNVTTEALPLQDLTKASCFKHFYSGISSENVTKYGSFKLACSSVLCLECSTQHLFFLKGCSNTMQHAIKIINRFLLTSFNFKYCFWCEDIGCWNKHNMLSQFEIYKPGCVDGHVLHVV